MGCGNLHHLPPSGAAQRQNGDLVFEDPPSAEMLTVRDCIENECNIQESLAINEGESSKDQEAKEDDNNDENDDGDEDLAANSGDVPTNPEGATVYQCQKK